jgi:glycerol kinase
MASYVLAIDQGTTGSTALVLDKKLKVKGKANKEFRQIFPKPGWVEHSVDDIWASVQTAVKGALKEAKIKPTDIAAIGITNQRETIALLDRKTGKPLHNAIVWQCRRTADYCATLKAGGHESYVKQKTGLVLDPYFSGTKMKWLLDHVSGARSAAERGDALFGTMDTILIHRLTKGEVHVTDVTNASRTLLMDLRTLKWDPQLLELFSVPADSLPTIVPSSGIVGHTKGLKFLPDGIPIAGIAGDQQAALMGEACFGEGEAKCTYGTGAFLLMNTGKTPVVSKHGLLTTVAWKIGHEVNYALEGSSFIAGAAVQWLRDGLKIIKSSADIEKLARTVPDTGGVAFVPALSGLGAPHWKPDARGFITGIDRGTTQAHIARATLEGIAFQIHDLVDAMRQDAGRQMPIFKADGGASMNGLLMQFQADLLGVTIERPKMVETTALGAAFLAGLGVGFWQNKEEVRQTWQSGGRFTPSMDLATREKHLARWKAAIAKA